ncbi:hypothetical protein [Roseateles asaccharophilus]|uniref:Uncharacterized protein n=1 Tax=Roseateles asaccharophilus TaxID=582607 RepID=A0ABU2A3Y9_9BURK|nr:hypothetical protein [Roseateles asaccharophilus]MDR7331904.1 hypothetical protein [Roseateles asaccharophilus]
MGDVRLPAPAVLATARAASTVQQRCCASAREPAQVTAALAITIGLPQPRWSRRRTLAASTVLVAHLALLWVIWQLRLQAQPLGHLRASMPIRFVPDRRLRIDPEAAAPIPERRRPTADQAPTTLRVVASVAEGSNVTGNEASHASATQMASPGPSASAPGPLALKPSRDVMLGSLSNPALSDPRSNTPKPTFEERIAMGLNPELCVKLERLPNGETRRRMGRMVDAQSAIQNTYGVGPHGIKVCE